ncbi:hypothetical protein BQ8794_30239 [Mesorhizobium prunaredense]|uniref:Uncharacterized protein n=1 Tax=Mesorhizobium prunaredense TaxID=1631249 RepID=A0A1R3VA54_9HYPH|nr:hypothetical protein BQ8794_30239 [Mesorhizobium prunaredense]
MLKEIRDNPVLWLLAFVPAVFVAQALEPEAHTLLFVLSVLAIVPLAALLNYATGSVATKTGDTGGRPSQCDAPISHPASRLAPRSSFSCKGPPFTGVCEAAFGEGQAMSAKRAVGTSIRATAIGCLAGP